MNKLIKIMLSFCFLLINIVPIDLVQAKSKNDNASPQYCIGEGCPQERYPYVNYGVVYVNAGEACYDLDYEITHYVMWKNNQISFISDPMFTMGDLFLSEVGTKELQISELRNSQITYNSDRSVTVDVVLKLKIGSYSTNLIHIECIIR